MTLQLMNHSIKNPYRVMEYVFVKVDQFYQFIFFTNLVILGTKKDTWVSLILKRLNQVETFLVQP